MWQGVKAVVEANANVRASVRESRTGDITRVWEWIGGIGGVGGGDWWMNTARKVKPEESQLPNEHPLEDVTNDLVKVEKTDQDEKK
ncbi:inner nuclear membrane protein enriched at telomere/subtelomere region, partial [Ascosphaera atra]